VVPKNTPRYRYQLQAQPPQVAGQADDLTLRLSRAELCRAIGETFLREAHQRATGTIGGSGKPSRRNEPRAIRRWRVLVASGLLVVALLTPLALFGRSTVARRLFVGETPTQLAMENQAVQSDVPQTATNECLPRLTLQLKGMHGTSLDFVCTPAEAAKQAGEQGKLVFLLHISGNFEDSGFT
jgi:hypothetical protein